MAAAETGASAWAEWGEVREYASNEPPVASDNRPRVEDLEPAAVVAASRALKIKMWK